MLYDIYIESNKINCDWLLVRKCCKKTLV